MKQVLENTLLLIALIFLFPHLQAQVVYRDYLTQDHSGQVENSVNFNGQTIDYTWRFKDMEKGQYFAEGEAIQKILYELDLSVQGQSKASFDVSMRDLIVSYYVEIKLQKGEETRTVMALYHKANRWVRLKGVLHDGCRRENVSWGRLDGVESYEQLMQFIVRQFDRNVDLGCYGE